LQPQSIERMCAVISPMVRVPCRLEVGLIPLQRRCCRSHRDRCTTCLRPRSAIRC